MSFLSNIYTKSVAENEKDIKFWEDYLNSLQSLDFSKFSDKLKVPTLVPVGSKIFFRGELKHTNEVTVALGADYFAKCSLKQAEILKQHRIKDAQSKLDTFKKQKEYLENQLSFIKPNAYEDQGQEIIESQTEEEDRAWREKHRENVRQFKQRKHKNENVTNVTDEELWDRLEELELQEELENEFLEMKEEENMRTFNSNPLMKDTIENWQKEKEMVNKVKEKIEKKLTDESSTSKRTPKHDLLQKVLDKQDELEKKLSELRNKDTDANEGKTVKDLISKLEEIEQIEELEDEMDRLDDILLNEGNDEDSEEENTSTSSQNKLQRSVSFADEDDSETLELTFKHSDVEPFMESYNPEKGILKPSDIYEAYSNLFGGATSILKKSKYETNIDPNILNLEVKKQKTVNSEGFKQGVEVSKTIVISDVVEKANKDNNKTENSRPTSLFKKKRQQMK